MYFNGQIDNLQVNVLDFSTATLTHKDLDLPVMRFDKNSLQKTVQALPMPVTVYDDSAASWLKDATMTEDQLKTASPSASQPMMPAPPKSCSITPSPSMTTW